MCIASAGPTRVPGGGSWSSAERTTIQPLPDLTGSVNGPISVALRIDRDRVAGLRRIQRGLQIAADSDNDGRAGHRRQRGVDGLRQNLVNIGIRCEWIAARLLAGACVGAIGGIRRRCVLAAATANREQNPDEPARSHAASIGVHSSANRGKECGKTLAMNLAAALVLVLAVACGSKKGGRTPAEPEPTTSP